jgi:hypothetical protein
MTKKMRSKFWETIPLGELNPIEWEALCDGCGKCCLIKLEDETESKVVYTTIACRLFDDTNCKCGNYNIRKKLVSDCVIITNDSLRNSSSWMPSTCAYRLIHEGKKLKKWHHLISGSYETVHDSGVSVRNSTISEFDIPEEHWEEYISEEY